MKAVIKQGSKYFYSGVALYPEGVTKSFSGIDTCNVDLSPVELLQNLYNFCHSDLGTKNLVITAFNEVGHLE
ncbi:MAG: hypothetical protein KAS32_24115 [Candidatus Peribacteraceae bacterium]|nr:hypothetical protein [Candidatus Peribacteraceae bacterium]